MRKVRFARCIYHKRYACDICGVHVQINSSAWKTDRTSKKPIWRYARVRRG